MADQGIDSEIQNEKLWDSCKKPGVYKLCTDLFDIANNLSNGINELQECLDEIHKKMDIIVIECVDKRFI